MCDSITIIFFLKYKKNEAGNWFIILACYSVFTIDWSVVCCNQRFRVWMHYFHCTATVSHAEGMISVYNGPVQVLVMGKLCVSKSRHRLTRKPVQVRGSVWAFSNLFLTSSPRVASWVWLADKEKRRRLCCGSPQNLWEKVKWHVIWFLFRIQAKHTVASYLKG